MTRAEVENLLALAEKATPGKRELDLFIACSADAIADLCRSLIAAEQHLADQKVIDDQDDAEWSILKERANSAEAREAVLRKRIERSAARHDAEPPDHELRACWHNEATLLRKALASTGSEAADGGDAAFMAAGFRRYGKKFADAIGALRRVR